MQAVTGIYGSRTDALEGVERLKKLGIPMEQINILTPETSDLEVEETVPIADTEQPGVGKVLGAVVGGAGGAALGGLGVTALGILLPGVGTVAAVGYAVAALLGAGGAVAGAAAGAAADNLVEGLPHDELFVYEDALRSGHTVLIAFAADDEQAEDARESLQRTAAEDVDAAREQWWVGLRDAEEEEYEDENHQFRDIEPHYRRGFEAALHPHNRGRRYEDVVKHLQERYPEIYGETPFRRGYHRGQRYHEGRHGEENPGK